MAAPTIEFDIQGLDPLLAKLARVDAAVKRKGGRAALRKAANVVVKAARLKVAAHDDPGTGRKIAKNIQLQWNNRLYRSTGDLGFRIGVRHGAVLPKEGEVEDLSAKGPTPHWRLLEFGTEKMAAFPFMRPALENNIQEVTAVFVAEFDKELDKALGP